MVVQRRQRQQDKLLEAELLSLDVEDLSHRRSYSEARGLEGWGSRGLGQERWGEFGSRREGGGLEGLREEVGRVRGKCESNGEALAAARLELLQLEERMAAGERENMQRFESVRRALKVSGPVGCARGDGVIVDRLAGETEAVLCVCVDDGAALQ